MDYPDVIKTLESEFMAKWSRFQKRQPIEEVKSFGKSIKELGIKNNLEFLVSYGDRLINSVDNFDIKNMRLMINEFGDMVHNIRSVQKGAGDV